MYYYRKLRNYLRTKINAFTVCVFSDYSYKKCDLEVFELSELGCQFDVILLEPPLHEYQRAQGAVFDKYWEWDEVGATAECHSLF